MDAELEEYPWVQGYARKCILTQNLWFKVLLDLFIDEVDSRFRRKDMEICAVV